MNFSFPFIVSILDDVAKAIPMTLLLTFLPVILGLILGFFLALARINNIPVLKQIVVVYNSFFRSIPLIVLLFLTYYGTPKLINLIRYGGERVVGAKSIDQNIVAVVTLTLYSAAFLSEIVRGALNSVNMKQMEAAHALGMTKAQTYLRIVIPQAIKVVTPNYFNFVLALLKGSSVVFTISVIDIMGAAKLQAEFGYKYVESYCLVGVIYIIFSIVLSYLFGWIEKRQKVY